MAWIARPFRVGSRRSTRAGLRFVIRGPSRLPENTDATTSHGRAMRVPKRSSGSKALTSLAASLVDTGMLATSTWSVARCSHPRSRHRSGVEQVVGLTPSRSAGAKLNVLSQRKASLHDGIEAECSSALDHSPTRVGCWSGLPYVRVRRRPSRRRAVASSSRSSSSRSSPSSTESSPAASSVNRMVS